MTLNVKEDGSFQIEDVDDHARVITGRYFLLAGLLELVQILVYQILKKLQKSMNFSKIILDIFT